MGTPFVLLINEEPVLVFRLYEKRFERYGWRSEVAKLTVALRLVRLISVRNKILVGTAYRLGLTVVHVSFLYPRYRIHS